MSLARRNNFSAKETALRTTLRLVCVVFGWETAGLKCLVLGNPRESRPQLPGASILPRGDLDRSARDVLETETGLKRVFLEQLYTFGPGERESSDAPCISVSYFALVSLASGSLKPDAGRWVRTAELTQLSLDQRSIVRKALERLKGKVRYQPIGFELLPKKFTLSQLQNLYETILERPLDKRNFRKKILSMDLLQPQNEFQSEVAHRAARLYCFDEKKYAGLRKRGFNFEI